MGIGVSLLLIAAGAILAWAVEFETSGIDLNVVGIILLIVGIIGLVLTLFFFGGPWARRSEEHTVVRDRQVP
ncbi:MAG TPA: DUF6458 family protein [Actinomycetota bacterium]|jgi:hypothetical protein|nr:DUF6458 family protein [Actinomycetota bacterium]